MGQAKRKWEELQEIKAEESLAVELGISYEELQDSGYWLEYGEDKYGFIGQRIVYFPEDAPKAILSKLNGLTTDNYIELPINNDYDEEERYEAQFRYLLEQKQFFTAFVSQINDVRRMNQVKMPADLVEPYNRQLFASCISVMETFLSDAFIKSLESKIEYKKKFLNAHDAFKKKEELSKVYESYTNIDKLIRKTINSISFHNLKTASDLFKQVLDIEFNISNTLEEAVDIRHHIVHRNGRNFRGEIVPIDKKMVERLISEVDGFVETVAAQLPLE